MAEYGHVCSEHGFTGSLKRLVNSPRVCVKSSIMLCLIKNLNDNDVSVTIEQSLVF